MEIIRGWEKRQNTRILQAFESAIAVEEVLGFDQAAAELAGRIAGALQYPGGLSASPIL